MCTTKDPMSASALTPTAEPSGEDLRLAAVHRYDILDSPPDGAFDRITALAARLLAVPISIVSIVDQDRIWFKSHHGGDAGQVGRDPGLCASAILQDEAWEVRDAVVDPRTLTNPLVTGALGLRFYLGIPLTTHDGYNLGTLCVIDREPRTASAEDIATLRDLASMVVDELELRLAAKRVIALELEARHRAEVLAEASAKTATSLEAGLGNSRMIGMAIGIVMARDQIDADAAFAKLRTLSNDLNLKLSRVAEQVVTRHNASSVYDSSATPTNAPAD
jgi:GAF domain-containing protein